MRADEMTSGQRCGRWTTFAALLLALSWAGALQAQTVTGLLLDGDTGEPLPGGVVSLLTEPGAVVAGVEADSTGAFTIRAPEPGSYFLRGEHIGYRAVTDGIFDLGEGGRLEVEIRLSTQPIELEGIEARVDRTDWVAVRQRQRLDNVGYYERQVSGFGYFIETDSLTWEPFHTEDLFKRVPGVRKRHGPLQLTRCSSRSFAGYVDGVRVFQGTAWDLDGLVADIAAVEVYPSTASVPLQYSGVGNSCGVVLIWTKG